MLTEDKAEILNIDNNSANINKQGTPIKINTLKNAKTRNIPGKLKKTEKLNQKCLNKLEVPGNGSSHTY